MAIFRNVQMSFWTDADIVDEYSPDDKLFYLYLLTNPHTNLCGCYEISIKQMAYDIGYSSKEIEKLLDKAENAYKTIAYSKDTKEILILKWSKFNWTSSEKFRTLLWKEIQQIKNQDFKEYLIDIFDGKDTVYEIFDTVSDKNGYRMQNDYTVTITDTVTDRVSDSDTVSDTETVKSIVDYLNAKLGTKYRANSDTTKTHIKARLKEGYTEQDFKAVIDKKYDEWHGTEQEKYLRPETLFGSKFEGYLNQKINSKKINSPPKNQNRFNNFDQREYDFDDLERQLLKGG